MSLIRQGHTTNLSFSVGKGSRDVSNTNLKRLLKRRKYEHVVYTSSTWHVLIPKELL